MTLLENGLVIVGGICLFLLMAAVVSDTGGRYFFDAPISGVYEISELYLMISIVFLGLAQTQRRQGHVRVSLLLDRLPVRISRLLEFSFLVAAAIVFSCITYVAARNGWTNITLSRWTTGVVAIPTGPSWLIVAIGAGTFSLRLVFDALSTIISPNIPEDDPSHAANDTVTENQS